MLISIAQVRIKLSATFNYTAHNNVYLYIGLVSNTRKTNQNKFGNKKSIGLIKSKFIRFNAR